MPRACLMPTTLQELNEKRPLTAVSQDNTDSWLFVSLFYHTFQNRSLVWPFRSPDSSRSPTLSPRDDSSSVSIPPPLHPSRGPLPAARRKPLTLHLYPYFSTRIYNYISRISVN